MKKTLLWMAAAAALMIGCPWLAVRFAGSAGMAVCFVLFFAVDPAFSLLLGAFAGWDIKGRWFLPVLNPALFLAGTWLFFEAGEPAFALYGGIYLLIGTAAMGVAALLRRKP